MRFTRTIIIFCGIGALISLNGCRLQKYPATFYVGSGLEVTGARVHEHQTLYWEMKGQDFEVDADVGLCEEGKNLKPVNNRVALRSTGHKVTCTVPDQNFSSSEKKEGKTHHFTYRINSLSSTVQDRSISGLSSDLAVRRFAEFNTDFDIDIESCKWC